MNYTFRTIIEPDERGTYHGYAPALSGCHTWGETLEDTQRNLKDAIAIYISSLFEDGEKIPTDRGFESFETINERDLLLAH